MALYSKLPNLKIHREPWGGVVRFDEGIATVVGAELTETLEGFAPTELDENELPKSVKVLVEIGLIVKGEG